MLLLAAGLVPLAPATAATVPGSVAGAFSVDPTGAGNYAIPIPVPPGVAGTQPDLKLIYSSRAPDGQLGVGWSLAGFSIVSRCPETVDQDGVSGGVSFTVSDKFCIDGQRIKAMPGNTYGADGSHYRTEKETYKDIESVHSVGGGPRYFTVRTLDGMTYTYGRVGCFLAASNNACVNWPVTNIVDQYGNFISYTYTVLSAGEYELSEIDYGNIQGTIVGKVVFGYSYGRPDMYYRYAGNTGAGAAPLNTTSRLFKISVYGLSSSTYVLARQYMLAYQISTTGRSLLSSITQCGSDGSTCLAPTTFTWSQTPTGFQSSTPSNTTISAGANDIQTGDFDGDGITDYLFDYGGEWYIMRGKNILTGGGWTDTGIAVTSNDEAQYALVGDINGDGCADLMVPRVYPLGSKSSTWWLQYTSDCAGHFTFLHNDLPTEDSETKHPILVDIDGDGLPELVYKYNGTLWFVEGNASGLAPQGWHDTTIPIADTQLIYPLNFFGNGFTQLYVTTDGVGVIGGGTAPPPINRPPPGGPPCGSSCHVDVVIGGGGSVGTAALTGTALTGTTQTATAQTATATQPDGSILDWNGSTLVNVTTNVPALSSQYFVLLDANGDGMTDMAFFDCFGQSCSWDLYLNEGGTWVNTSNTAAFTVASSLQAGFTAATRVMDYNGDGLQDLVYPNPNGASWVVLKSLGTTLPNSAVSTGMPATNPATAMVVDYDGDGLPDLAFPNGTWKVYLRGAGSSMDLLTQVTDGFGRNIYIEYEPLNTPWVSLYGGPMDSNSSPNLVPGQVRNFLGSLYVVAQYGVETATAGANTVSIINTDYQYWGAKMDTQGWGFLGFYQVQATNVNTGIITVNISAQQDFPYTGMVTESDVYAVAGPIQPVDSTNIQARIQKSCLAVQDGQQCTGSSPPLPPAPAIPRPGDLVDSTAYTLASLTPTGASGRSIFPYVQSSARERDELYANGHFDYQQIATTYTYDGWGEVTKIVATTTDSQAG
ncbi:MAG TPA: FG-GAP-like repeat-containing protein [Gammaproteobacteria bacterium]